MLRCQVYYEPYFKTSLKCLKEGSEFRPDQIRCTIAKFFNVYFLIIYLFVLPHDNNQILLKTTAETSVLRKHYISVATLLC